MLEVGAATIARQLTGVGIIGGVPPAQVRATMTQLQDGWLGRMQTPPVEVRARTREGCLSRLRRAAGGEGVLTVEITPALVGVAEAAAILGWDRRRVITYVDRGAFPEPVARLASGRVWRREDVETFSRSWSRKRARRGRR